MSMDFSFTTASFGFMCPLLLLIVFGDIANRPLLSEVGPAPLSSTPFDVILLLIGGSRLSGCAYVFHSI